MTSITKTLRFTVNAAYDLASAAGQYRDVFFSLVTVAEDFFEEVICGKTDPLRIFLSPLLSGLGPSSLGLSCSPPFLEPENFKILASSLKPIRTQTVEVARNQTRYFKVLITCLIRPTDNIENFSERCQ